MTAPDACVTVVVPARDAAGTLEHTLGSILGQGPMLSRVIVVDDASSDGTAEVAARFSPRVGVVQGQGLGPAAARNTGVASVVTPYLAFCDADDLWPDARLTRDVRVLESDADLAILLGRTRFDPDEPDLVEGLAFDGDDRTALIPHFGAATMRTSAFHQVGLLEESLSNYEDYDWFLRARECAAGLVTHDRVSLLRRIHVSSTSRRNPPAPRDLLSVLGRSVRRRGIDPESLPRLDQLRAEVDR